MGRACCVSGCSSGVKVPSHKFPKNPRRCTEWVNNLNLTHLKNYDSNKLQKFKVCHKHFYETDYSCSSYHRFLKDTAIPFIEDTNIDAIVSNLQQQQLQQQNLLQDKNIEQTPTELQNQLVEQQTYNEQQHEVQKIQIQEIEEQNQLQQVMQENISDKRNEEAKIEDHECRIKQLEEKVNFILKTPRKNERNRPDLQEITRKAYLTPKAKRLYETTVKLRRDNRRLRRLLKHSRKENITSQEQTKTLSLINSDNKDFKTDSIKVR